MGNTSIRESPAPRKKIGGQKERADGLQAEPDEHSCWACILQTDGMHVHPGSVPSVHLDAHSKEAFLTIALWILMGYPDDSIRRHGAAGEALPLGGGGGAASAHMWYFIHEIPKPNLTRSNSSKYLASANTLSAPPSSLEGK